MKFLGNRIKQYRRRDEWFSQTKNSDPWFVYIVTCNDGTLYTGITKDVERRVKEHNSANRGAKYTRYRRPVVLAGTRQVRDRSQALKFEMKIKKQKKKNKIKFLLSESVQ